MNILVIIFLIIMAIYPLNYVKYNWKKKQYLQSLGMLLVIAVILILPVFILFSR